MHRRVTKAELLDMAKAAVADRGAHYGPPSENFERIAARWRAHIKNAFGIDVALTAHNVAVMCADMKLARLEHEPAHLDSWVDLAGYSACGADIATERAPPITTMAEYKRMMNEKMQRELDKTLYSDSETTVMPQTPLARYYATGKWTEGAPLDF